jgi:hypothetical protein
MARVVASGGRVAALEPDWDTLVIHADPLTHTRTITRAWSDHVRHGTIGRQLGRLLADAGLSAIEVTPLPKVLRDPALAETLLELDTTATAALEPRDADAWLAGLRERAARGRFLAAVTSFHVIGHKQANAHDPDPAPSAESTLPLATPTREPGAIRRSRGRARPARPGADRGN